MWIVCILFRIASNQSNLQQQRTYTGLLYLTVKCPRTYTELLYLTVKCPRTYTFPWKMLHYSIDISCHYHNIMGRKYKRQHTTLINFCCTINSSSISKVAVHLWSLRSTGIKYHQRTHKNSFILHLFSRGIFSSQPSYH